MVAWKDPELTSSPGHAKCIVAYGKMSSEKGMKSGFTAPAQQRIKGPYQDGQQRQRQRCGLIQTPPPCGDPQQGGISQV